MFPYNNVLTKNNDEGMQRAMMNSDDNDDNDDVNNNQLECGPMPVIAALSNIGGALCSTPQSLADAHQ